MKLVFTSYTSAPGYDEPRQWLQRIRAWTGILEELSQQNTVISIGRINYKGELEVNGVQYIFTGAGTKALRFPWSMHRLIKNLKPDVVFVNGFIFPLQVLQLRLKLGSRIKIVVINHAERPFKGIRKFLQSRADMYIRKYLFTSKEMGQEWVQQGIIADERKIEDVMEASSYFQVMDKLSARSKTKVRGNPVFLWVGRLDKNKDPITVIKAFGKFTKFQPSAMLYMIYHTEELKHEIEAFCLDNGLDNAIKMVGRISHEEMENWYNSADFIISGSHYEGSGVAVCEAMSCACIPVVTNIYSFRKMTGPGKCGGLYEPGNEKELLNLLLETSKWDINQERAKTLKQFNDELSFAAIAKKINRIIRSL